jgi:outer membrane autotransporter protein
VAASSISPAVQSLWHAGTSTLFQREGSHRDYQETGKGGAVATYEDGAGVWMRGFSSSGGVAPVNTNNYGGSNNLDFDFTGKGFELGIGYAFNSNWTLGVLGGQSDSRIKPVEGGRVQIDANTYGGYLTYAPGMGLYVDLTYRAMNFDGYGNGSGDDFSFDGKAKGYSVELGYGYKTASGLVVEPQFQYSMVDVDVNTITYTNYDFEVTDGDSTQMRLGVALRKSFKTANGNDWTPYGALSYIEESDGANSYQIGGLLAGDVSTEGGSTLLEVGATGRFGGFGISGGLNWRDGGAFDSVVGGQVSLRYDW